MRAISIEIQSPSTEYEFPMQIHSSVEYGLPLYASSPLSRADTCISRMSSTDVTLHGLCSARGSTTSINSTRRYDVRSSMENEHEVPLQRIRCLRGLYQCGFHPAQGQADIKFKWTVNSQLERESSQSRNGWKSLPSLRRAKTNQQIQNKPFDKFLAYQREKTLPNLPLKSDLKSSFKIKDSIDAISKSESIADEEILLPTLSSARSLGEAWLLRRPTLIQSEPLTEDETMFQTFTKTIDLKPLNFQNTKDQYIFYSNHYPLILQSQEEEEKLGIQRKRTPTPDPLKDPEERRKITRINRMNYLEDSLDDLERELDDMEFRTVLKDDVFYPQKWPWNKNRDSYHTISSSKLKSPSPNGSNRAKSPVPNIKRSKSPSPVKEVRRLRSPKKERSS